MTRKLFLLFVFLLTCCVLVQAQSIILKDRVLDTWTETWVEERLGGTEILHRESKHVILYLDRDVLRIGDDRYEIIRDIGLIRDIRGTLSMRFEALDKRIRRVRLVFLTGKFINQIQIIYADRVYKYNLEQHW